MSNQETLKDFIKGKTVVVVGNSERMLERDYSKFIDSFDVVIRLNHGKPLATTGTKTTIWASIYKVEKPTMLREHYKKFNSPIIVRFGTRAKKPMTADLESRTWFVKSDKQLLEMFRNRKAEGRGEPRAYPSIGSRVVDWLYTELDVEAIDLVGFDFFDTGTWYRPGEENCYKCHTPSIDKKFIVNHPAVTLHEYSQ